MENEGKTAGRDRWVGQEEKEEGMGVSSGRMRGEPVLSANQSSLPETELQTGVLMPCGRKHPKLLLQPWHALPDPG